MSLNDETQLITTHPNLDASNTRHSRVSGIVTREAVCFMPESNIGNAERSEALRGEVFGERYGKPRVTKWGFPQAIIFSFFHFFPIPISRSGRRGRMPRHMRDNMASWRRDIGMSCPEGKRFQISMPRICLPLSSPGVCGTNPPAKPTGKFYEPNRQWCSAPRGGGEGSPCTRVTFEQQKRTCCNPSAISVSVSDRQQQARFSKHRRTASSTARIRDLLEIEMWHDIHLREAQQNMGTGNAALSRCLYPFLRPREIFNRTITPLFKTVRAGVAC